MPLSCDVCGDPIYRDADIATVTGMVEEAGVPVAVVPDLIACPTCQEAPAGVWIDHRNPAVRTCIEPAWAL